MDIIDTPLENTLKYLLQRNITFHINNKMVKSGKLILFRQNNYCIDLNLLQNKPNKKDERVIYTIPIPFTAVNNITGVIFDYKLSTLVGNNRVLLTAVKNIVPSRKIKYYDTILTMKLEQL